MFTLPLDDRRKRVLPKHFEQQVFLFANKPYGTLKTLIMLLLKLDKYIFSNENAYFSRESYS